MGLIFFSENDEVDPTIKVMISTMYLPAFLQRILSRLLTLVSRVIVSEYCPFIAYLVITQIWIEHVYVAMCCSSQIFLSRNKINGHFIVLLKNCSLMT